MPTLSYGLPNMKPTEILKLRELLNQRTVPYEWREPTMSLDSWQIFYPNSENRICSIIQGPTSYGGKLDLLEITGLLKEGEGLEEEDVVGFLSAEEVFSRIMENYLSLEE